MSPKRRIGALRLRVARLLLPAASESGSNPGAFYAQHPSCQIPTLSHLLSLFLGERTDGLFVEVGAYDGVFASNSWGLAQRGWRGLMIEPVPDLAQACRKNYAHQSGIEVIETAIGRPSSASLSLNVAGTLTTANNEVFDEYKVVDWARNGLTGSKLTVPCTTLDELLGSRHFEPGLDLLIVDVEGFEADVFAGFDLERWSPRMMIVELLDTHPDLSATAASDSHLGEKIQERGYRIAYKDSINTVFVRKDVWQRALGTEGR